MADAVWVGVDLGTQSVRTVAVGSTGTVLSAAARPLTSSRDGNRHEQDPHEWWAQVGRRPREMVRGLPDGAAASIAGVAVDGTSGTVLLTDPDGTPRTPGLMYDDSRAGALARARRRRRATRCGTGCATGSSRRGRCPSCCGGATRACCATAPASPTSPTSSRRSSSGVRSPPTPATRSRPATT